MLQRILRGRGLRFPSEPKGRDECQRFIFRFEAEAIMSGEGAPIMADLDEIKGGEGGSGSNEEVLV